MFCNPNDVSNWCKEFPVNGKQDMEARTISFCNFQMSKSSWILLSQWLEVICHDSPVRRQIWKSTSNKWYAKMTNQTKQWIQMLLVMHTEPHKGIYWNKYHCQNKMGKSRNYFLWQSLKETSKIIPSVKRTYGWCSVSWEEVSYL